MTHKPLRSQFTPAELRKILEQKLATGADLARKYGVTRQAIHDFAHNAPAEPHPGRRPKLEGSVMRIRRDVNKGWCQKKLARCYCVTQQTMHRFLTANGLKPRDARGRPRKVSGKKDERSE